MTYSVQHQVALTAVPSPPLAERLASQLALGCSVNPATQLATFEPQYFDAVVKQREAIVPAITRQLAQSALPLPAIISGLHALELLKKANVRGVDHAYGVVSRYQEHPSPLVQQALAQFYTTLDITCQWGPAMVGLLRSANKPTPTTSPLDTSQAWGHAVLDGLSQTVAKDTVKLLLPVLQANGLRLPPGYEQQLNRNWAGEPFVYQQGTTTWLA